MKLERCEASLKNLHALKTAHLINTRSTLIILQNPHFVAYVTVLFSLVQFSSVISYQLSQRGRSV